MSTGTTAKETGAFQRLTADERAEARAIARDCNVRDAAALTYFGTKPQEALGALTDPVMKMVATKDAGEAGKALTALMTDIRALKADSLASWIEPPIARLPLVGRWFSLIRQFISQYEKIAVKIDRATGELTASKDLLARDVTLLDRLYAENLACYRGLLTYIAAGEMKLDDVRAEQDGLAAEAAAAGDAFAAQEAADLANALASLERRVYDLKLAATIAVQSGPQIRLVQNADRALVEKTQTLLLMTIPLWKQQVIIAIGLFNQRKAIELQRAVSRTTNELMEKNAAMMKQGAVEATRESERGIVELETLQKVNQSLIDTLAETLRIQEEARQRRQAVERELEKLHADIETKLRQAQQATGSKPADVKIPEDKGSEAAPPPESEDELLENLTPREVEVVRLLVQEKSDSEIANTLVISVRTVQAHERSIYGKFGVSTRRDAARVARERMLVKS